MRQRNHLHYRCALRLEPLTGRLCPAAFVYQQGPSLLVLGDDAPNQVSIDDDGLGNGTVTVDGLVTPFTEVRQLVVKTRGGDDTVAFVLTGDLRLATKVQIDLGPGNDAAAIDLSTGGGSPGTVAINSALHVYLLGGAGDDTMTSRFGPVNSGEFMNNGGARTVHLIARLGDGDDSLDSFLDGRLATGTSPLSVRVDANGGAGNDSLNVHANGVNADPGVGLAFLIHGGAGDDFAGVDFSGALDTVLSGATRRLSSLSIFVDAGTGDDVVSIGVTRTGGTGKVSALILGGVGDDDLTAHANASDMTARLDGGFGFDTAEIRGFSGAQVGGAGHSPSVIRCEEER